VDVAWVGGVQLNGPVLHQSRHVAAGSLVIEDAHSGAHYGASIAGDIPSHAKAPGEVATILLDDVAVGAAGALPLLRLASADVARNGIGEGAGHAAGAGEAEGIEDLRATLLDQSVGDWVKI